MDSASTFESQAGMPTPHTCSYCQEIEVKLPDHANRWMARVIRGGRGTHRFAEIEGSRVLKQSESCKFFQWAMDGFKKKHKDVQIDDNWKLIGNIPYQFLERGSTDVPFITFTWYHWIDSQFQLYTSLDMLSVLSEENDPASQMIPRRPGTRGPFSDLPIEILNHFLHECLDQHGECNISTDSCMPTYLIEILENPEISSNPTLRLVHRSPRVKYAALSYCWGGDQSLKLKTSVLSNFTQAIQYGQLPKTLKDAVTVARMLGLSFLWIDALCIVQDDIVHIAHEIAMMPSIYQNAYITIYAARSSHVDQGFLDELVIPSTFSHVFQFRIRTPDDNPSYENDGRIVGDYFIPGIVGSVICFCNSDMSHIINPIEKRGWTFQEYLLSPRILEFGTYRTSYKCLTVELRAVDDINLDYWKFAEQQSEIRSGFHNLKTTTDSDRPSASSTWKAIVEAFTRRLVSNPRDRVLAISGIAKVQGHREGETYLAGLWREHLLTQLRWEVTGPSWDRKLRPLEYRAPSWSWAAVDGSVTFNTGSVPEASERDLRILHAQVDLEEQSAPHGAVRHGSLIVRGWLKRKLVANGGESLVNPGWKPDRDAYNNEREPKPLGNEFGPVLITQDSIGEFIDGLPVYCLEVTRYAGKTRPPYGLVLVTQDDKVFRRIGVFKFDGRVSYPLMAVVDDQLVIDDEVHRTWMDGAELRDITII